MSVVSSQQCEICVTEVLRWAEENPKFCTPFSKIQTEMFDLEHINQSIWAAESLILEAKFRVWLQPHWRRTCDLGSWILSSHIVDKEPLQMFFILEILRKVRQIDRFSLSSLLTAFVPAEKCPQCVQATLVESFADLASAAELTFGLHLSLKREQTLTTLTVKVKAWRQFT